MRKTTGNPTPRIDDATIQQALAKGRRLRSRAFIEMVARLFRPADYPESPARPAIRIS